MKITGQLYRAGNSFLAMLMRILLPGPPLAVSYLTKIYTYPRTTWTQFAILLNLISAEHLLALTHKCRN